MKRFLAIFADKKFIWVRTLFISVFVALIIAIGISVPSSSVAQTWRQVSEFNSFAELCQNRESLSPISRHTVEYLIAYVPAPRLSDGSPNCEKIGEVLAKRTYIEPNKENETNLGSDIKPLQSKAAPFGPLISDIRPLEFAPNLTRLSLNGSYVCDFSPLKYLPKLTDVSIDSIKDLNVLAPLADLTRLAFSHAYFDISPLRSHTKLTTLRFSGRNIDDYTPLESLTNLTELQIANTSLRRLDSLKPLTKLVSLNLGCNWITDVKPLESLVNLEYLSIRNNRNFSISPLAYLTKLKHLELDYIQKPDLTVLKTLTNLVELHLPYTNISDISSLKSLVNLEYLDLEGNKISDITPLLALPKLKLLRINGNPISDPRPLKSLKASIDVLFNPKIRQPFEDCNKGFNFFRFLNFS